MTPAVPQELSSRARSLSASVYRVGRPPDGVVPVPLNVGDTFLPPPAVEIDTSEPHRYTPPAGLPSLREALAERIHARSGQSLSPDAIIVTPGGTAALSAVVGAMVNPGDSVLICAPYWPLIAGITRIALAEPVAVPLFTGALTAEAVNDALEAAHQPGAKAIYVNAIHNPTGRLLSDAGAAALVEFARRHDLWILADDVYEDFVYTDAEAPNFLALAPERTVQINSASKAFGIAGARVGWAAGAPEPVKAALKLHLNTGYCAPLFGQRITEQCLRADGPGPVWQATARQAYADAGRAAAERLGVAPPLGGQFMFVDVADALDPVEDEALISLLRRCLQAGVALAPGTSCGPYPHHVRICFTSAPPADVARGVEAFAEVLGR
ncbi:MAG: pyridoxal phosphate-dependent aminotransferase [Myxococcota bacterium]